MTDQPCSINMNLLDGGYEVSGELAGRAVSLAYASGHTLEQHWLTDHQIKWKGVVGALAGYSQLETYNAFKIADGLFLISWIEETTTAETSAEQVAGPWLTDVILDFNTMRAMASWTGPTADGGSEHVLDQATMEYIELDAT